jgi:hypothetical protein
VEHGKHDRAAPLGGLGQLLPPLMVVPRHVHGLTVVRLPQASPGFSCVHVPSTRPATLPYTLEHDCWSRAPLPHAVSQHTASTQNVEAHWAPVEQGSPRA